MGKLSIVTDSNSSPEKLKIDVSDKKIYYGDSEGTVVIIEGSLKYRPLHCSELNNRLANRDWNKSETLFISRVSGEDNEDDPILRYRKYTNPEYRPTGEIDEIDASNESRDLSFPLCGKLSDDVKELIDDKYNKLFDSSMKASEEMSFLESTKHIIDTSECQESIDLIKGYDSYTDSLDINELIEYSSYPGTSARLELIIRYSMLNRNTNEATIYNHNTILKAFEYDEDRNLLLENAVEVIGDNLVRLEYLGGIVRVFPISTEISECIINYCTAIYGKFTR